MRTRKEYQIDNTQRRSPNEQLAASEEDLEGRLKFETLLARFAEAGIDIDAMADQLQNEEAASFVKSWIELMTGIASKSAALWQARQAKKPRARSEMRRS